MSYLSVVLFMLLVVPYINFRNPKVKSNQKRWSWYYQQVINNRFIIMVSFTTVFVASMILGTKIEFNYNAFSLLPKVESVVEQENLISELGISLEYSIVVSENLESARQVNAMLIEDENIAYVDSVVKFIPESLSLITSQLDSLRAFSHQLTNLEKAQLKMIKVNAPFGFDDKKTWDIKSFLTQLYRFGDTDTLNIGSIDSLPQSIKSKYISEEGNLATYVFGGQIAGRKIR